MTNNQLIQSYAVSAFAYIPREARADWLRGWRGTATRVKKQALVKKLRTHVDRMRLEADQKWCDAQAALDRSER